MNINRNNYQVYFLDYFEGRLQAQQVAELMVFLEANSDLNEEFESFEMIELQPTRTNYSNKKSLKKNSYVPVGSVTAFNYEKWLIARMENDLSALEVEELNAFLDSNPSARLEYDLFLKSKLLPDAIPMPGKESLRKKGMVLWYQAPWMQVLAAAAVFVLFVVLWLNYRPLAEQTAEADRNQLPTLEPIEPQEVPVVPDRILARNQHTDKLGDVVSGDIASVLIQKRDPAGISGMSRISANLLAMEEMRLSDAGLLVIDGRASRSVDQEILEAVFDPEEKKTSFAARFAGGVFAKLFGSGQQGRKSLLEYTVDGYNLMADRELDVEKEMDPSGKVVAYRINGEVIKIGHKVNSGPVE